MRKLYYIIVILSLSIMACDENNIPLEIIGTDQSITVTSPPDEVFEIAMKPRRDETLLAWTILYYADEETLDAFSLEFKQAILKKLDGVAIEDYGPILLDQQKAFYTKYIDAAGIAIIADAAVKDIDMIWARHVVLTMTAKHPELREFFQIEDGFYLVLLDGFTPMGDMPIRLFDVPLYDNSCYLRSPNEFGDRVGNCWAHIRYQDDTADRLYILAHEFAHALDRSIEYLSPGFFDKLDIAYKAAKERAREEGSRTRAIISGFNAREYWAHGTYDWFYEIGTDIFNSHESYESLAEKDPLLFELLDEWFVRETLLIPFDPNDPADVNGDGRLTWADAVLVDEKWGERCQCPEDVNGDGIVDIDDYGYVTNHPYLRHIDEEDEEIENE